MQTKGLFRLSPAQKALQAAKEVLDAGGVPLALHTPADCHVAASLLKMYLRMLPQKLVPYEALAEFAAARSTADTVARVQTFLAGHIAPHALPFLRRLLQLLAEVVENVESNEMTPENLSLIFAPNLVEGSLADLPAQIALVRYLIVHAQELLDAPADVCENLCSMMTRPRMTT